MAIPITEAFKRFRRDLKLSQRDVAKRLNITQPAYAVYESKGNSPTGATLIKMATAFDVSTDYLLGLTDDPRPVDEILKKSTVVNVSPVESETSNQPTDNLKYVTRAEMAALKESLVAQGIKI